MGVSMSINIMIKTSEGVKVPKLSTKGSAGFDIAAYEDTFVYSMDTGIDTRIRTGLYLEIPVGYVGLLVERSSLHTKGLTLANNIGIIDSDYRGEVQVAVTNLTKVTIKVEQGQRIAQLVIVPVPEIKLINVDDLNESIRGCGGFGSTGS